MPKIAAIDIGINGCLAVTDHNFQRPVLIDDLVDILPNVGKLLKQEGVSIVVVEEPLFTPLGRGGVPASFCTTWYNYGRLRRELEIHPHIKKVIAIQPKTWQVVKEGRDSSKDSTAQFLVELFPELECYMYRPSKTDSSKRILIDGRSDALAIAYWYFKLGEGRE